jgi:hypothetical protein
VEGIEPHCTEPTNHPDDYAISGHAGSRVLFSVPQYQIEYVKLRWEALAELEAHLRIVYSRVETNTDQRFLGSRRRPPALVRVDHPLGCLGGHLTYEIETTVPGPESLSLLQR